MSRESTDYEKFVRDITETLLRAQGLETVKVEHDVQLPGIARSRQVDVYWEYRCGGISHRVIINCKRYKNPVEVNDVEALQGALTDMPGVRGVIVTTVGFQKGAIEYAQTHGIGLKVIRPPEDADWMGRLREIQLSVRIDPPELLSCRTDLDEEWLKANGPDPASVVGHVVHDAQLSKVRDVETGVLCDMNDLWNRAMLENPTAAGQQGTGTLRWNNAMFESPGASPLKIVGMEFRWKVNVGRHPITTTIRPEPTAIVRDAIAGTLLFVDPDGRITGDVERELGRKP